ncbi:LOW QUALITY PROTEIN: G2/mitotic-specific cyclin-B2, partial [Frankliniella fusca]
MTLILCSTERRIVYWYVVVSSCRKGSLTSVLALADGCTASSSEATKNVICNGADGVDADASGGGQLVVLQALHLARVAHQRVRASAGIFLEKSCAGDESLGVLAVLVGVVAGLALHGRVLHVGAVRGDAHAVLSEDVDVGRHFGGHDLQDGHLEVLAVVRREEWNAARRRWPPRGGGAARRAGGARGAPNCGGGVVGEVLGGGDRGSGRRGGRLEPLAARRPGRDHGGVQVGQLGSLRQVLQLGRGVALGGTAHLVVVLRRHFDLVGRSLGALLRLGFLEALDGRVASTELGVVKEYPPVMRYTWVWVVGVLAGLDSVDEDVLGSMVTVGPPAASTGKRMVVVLGRCDGRGVVGRDAADVDTGTAAGVSARVAARRSVASQVGSAGRAPAATTAAAAPGAVPPPPPCRAAGCSSSRRSTTTGPRLVAFCADAKQHGRLRVGPDVVWVEASCVSATYRDRRGMALSISRY